LYCQTLGPEGKIRGDTGKKGSAIESSSALLSSLYGLVTDSAEPNQATATQLTSQAAALQKLAQAHEVEQKSLTWRLFLSLERMAPSELDASVTGGAMTKQQKIIQNLEKEITELVLTRSADLSGISFTLSRLLRDNSVSDSVITVVAKPTHQPREIPLGQFFSDEYSSLSRDVGCVTHRSGESEACAYAKSGLPCMLQIDVSFSDVPASRVPSLTRVLYELMKGPSLHQLFVEHVCNQLGIEDSACKVDSYRDVEKQHGHTLEAAPVACPYILGSDGEAEAVVQQIDEVDDVDDSSSHTVSQANTAAVVTQPIFVKPGKCIQDVPCEFTGHTTPNIPAGTKFTLQVSECVVKDTSTAVVQDSVRTFKLTTTFMSPASKCKVRIVPSKASARVELVSVVATDWATVIVQAATVYKPIVQVMEGTTFACEPHKHDTVLSSPSKKFTFVW